jgi:hypothetical protein
MHQQTPQPPIVDGTAVSSMPSASPMTCGEGQLTPLPNLQQMRAETPQRTTAERKDKARPTPRVHFEKRTSPSKRGKVVKDEDIISSFDLHPREDAQEREHEQ